MCSSFYCDNRNFHTKKSSYCLNEFWGIYHQITWGPRDFSKDFITLHTKVISKWTIYIFLTRNNLKISDFDSIIAIILSNESIRPRTKSNNYSTKWRNNTLTQSEFVFGIHHMSKVPRNWWLETAITPFPSDWRFMQCCIALQ